MSLTKVMFNNKEYNGHLDICRHRLFNVTRKTPIRTTVTLDQVTMYLMLHKRIIRTGIYVFPIQRSFICTKSKVFSREIKYSCELIEYCCKTDPALRGRADQASCDTPNKERYLVTQQSHRSTILRPNTCQIT